jgi:hypothetical protein
MANGSTTARVKATKADNKSPHLGFNRALKQALSQLSSEVGKGDYAVTVEFEADVEVSNPGVIGFFKVRLTTPGG